MMSSFRIVKLIRECCNCFNVIIPFRAHSAGTQVCLGANGIVAGKLAELGPVDPSAISPFNPIMNPQGNPADPRNRKPVKVEDVQAYLNFAEERVGLISEKDKLEVFKLLVSTIEPLALGNLNRGYNDIRFLARHLLELHMDKSTELEKIDEIVKQLTEVYTHEFIITRDVAENIGLNVIRPDAKTEELIMNLFEIYERELKMNDPFDAENILTSIQPPNRPVNFKMKLGFIESESMGYTFIAEGTVFPPAQIPQMRITPSGQVPLPMSPPSATQVPTVRLKTGKWIKILGDPEEEEYA